MQSLLRSKRRRRSIATALVLGTTVALAACGSSNSSSTTSASNSGASATSTAASTQHVNLAYLMIYRGSFPNGTLGPVNQVAAANNASVTVFSANEDTTQQASQCQDAIASHKYQGILIYPVDNAAAVPCVKQAIAAGIKVVDLDTTLGPSFTSTAIQVPGLSGQVLFNIDADVAGTTSLIEKACSGITHCQVALLEGVPAATYSSVKVKVESANLAKAGIDVVGVGVTGFDSPSVAISKAKTLIAAHPGLNVIASDDDFNVQGLVKAVQLGQISKTIKLIGDGGDALALKSIKDGLEFGSMYSGPGTEGKAAAEMLIQAVRGEPIANRDVLLSSLPSGLYPVTKANVAQAVAQW